MLAFTRVLGAAAMNIAEAAVALFFAELGPGTVREGPDELARAQPVRGRHRRLHRGARRPGSVGAWTPSSGPSGGRRRPGPGLSPTRPTRRRRRSEPRWLRWASSTWSVRRAWSQAIDLRDAEPGPHPVRVGRLVQRRPGRWPRRQDDRGRGLLRRADGGGRLPHRDRGRAAPRHDDAVLPPARGAVGVGPVTPREGDYFGPLVNLLSRLVKSGRTRASSCVDRGRGAGPRAGRVVGPGPRTRGLARSSKARSRRSSPSRHRTLATRVCSRVDGRTPTARPSRAGPTGASLR